MSNALRHASRRPVAPGAAAVRELWVHLSATMRLMRHTAAVSLRQVESESGIGRGTLSQIETGKARPNRFVVEWYDTAFGGDGMLLAMFAEARGAHGPTGATAAAAGVTPGDALTVLAATPSHGQLVECDSAVRVRWTLCNAGSVPWHGRRLARLGARAGIRLLSSNADDPLPDCEPGDEVAAELTVGVPSVAASYAAFWQVVDADGNATLPIDFALSVDLVARHL